MTADQRISWIAIPAGPTDDGGLRVSLVVSPRLRSDSPSPTLAEFPDLLTWPDRLLDPATAVELVLPDDTRVPLTLDTGPVDPTLWTSLFTADVPVAPFRFDDHADRPIISYSRADIVSFLRTTWAETLAAAPDELPATVSRLRQEPQVIGLDRRLAGLLDSGLLARLEGPDAGDELDDRLRSLLAVARRTADLRRSGALPRGGPALEPLPADGSLGRHFERVLAFHRRPADLQEFPDDAATAEVLRDSADFHQMLSALGDHPALLRRLGLIVDARIEPGTLPDADPAGPGRIRLLPTWTSLLPGASTDLRPWTTYVATRFGDRTVFRAAPSTAAAGPTPELFGLRDLPGGTFSLDQVDADGAALKTLGTAATVTAAASRPDADTPIGEPEQSGLPALRTGGIALVATGRAEQLQTRFNRSLDLETALAGDPEGGDVVLTADDLVRGHRLDVAVDGGTPASLHARRVRYGIVARPHDPVLVEDEGFFTVAAAGPATPPGTAPDPGSEIYVAETLATWDGWSLSAPRPGRAISRDPRAPDPDVPESQLQRPENRAFTALGLEIDARVQPGTLPRLRFGGEHRVRLRTVDLAGNGPTTAEADALLAEFAAEPAFGSVLLAADEPHLRFEPVPPPALAPRTPYREGASAQRLVLRSDADLSAQQWADANPGYLPIDERHVVPPKASVELVERHRLLDGVIGGTVGAPPTDEQRATIAATYSWLTHESRTLADADTGEVMLVEIPAAGGPTGVKPQVYAVHTEEQAEVPYLADPLAVGVVLFGLPGAVEPTVVRFGDPVGPTSAGPRPFRLRIVDGAAAPEFDEVRRVLTVGLRQATTATVRLASLVDQLELSALLAWCQSELDGAACDRVVQAMKENRCWALTPWQELRLVHATQRPLLAPGVGEFALSGRSVGDTRAELRGRIELDLPSTEQLDVVAVWSEMVDDPARPGPERRSMRTVVFSLPMRVAATGQGPDREWPYWIEDDRLVGFDTRLTRSRGLPLPLGHEFGDTKHRAVAYSLVASTPFREYFTPEWATEPDRLTRTTSPDEDSSLAVTVPSSARPAPPRVLDAVPTLTWSDVEVDGVAGHKRAGGGIRVYLDRPWFSSGDGELLGVVVGSYVPGPREAPTPYVTLFGRDPARGGTQVETATVPAFRNPTTVSPSLPLVETSRPGVAADYITVVGYEVSYDAASRRWYGDIDMDLGSTVGSAPGPAYLPFVRLALVRYQPTSLAGQQISTVATVDLVQPLPDRTVTVIPWIAWGEDAQVSVYGVAASSYRSATQVHDEVRRITAWLELRDPRVADETLGWRIVSGVGVLGPVAGDPTRWSGRVPFPDELGELRMVVQEEEFLPAEGPGGGLDGRTSRIVYVDAVRL